MKASENQHGFRHEAPSGRVVAAAAALAAFAALATWGAARHTRPPERPHSSRPQEPCPYAIAALLSLPPPQLARLDIAQMNLLCCSGLPGAENIAVNDCLQTLDQWAEHARSETERHLYRFRANPAEYENSEGYFRMLMLSVVAYEDFGIRYNPQKMSAPESAPAGDDNFFADSRDVFLHGLTGGKHTGTCSSMPVLYVALGRRLGYPLKLVTTKGHLFVRWESPTERFDLEATSKGMNKYDDAHFRNWPFPVSDKEIEDYGYLKSLSPAEELAVFLTIRSACLREAGRNREAVSVLEAASRLAPGWKGTQALLAAAREAAERPPQTQNVQEAADSQTAITHHESNANEINR